MVALSELRLNTSLVRYLRQYEGVAELLRVGFMPNTKQDSTPPFYFISLLWLF